MDRKIECRLNQVKSTLTERYHEKFPSAKAIAVVVIFVSLLMRECPSNITTKPLRWEQKKPSVRGQLHAISLGHTIFSSFSIFQSLPLILPFLSQTTQ
jgi:hypothetical protein